MIGSPCQNTDADVGITAAVDRQDTALARRHCGCCFACRGRARAVAAELWQAGQASIEEATSRSTGKACLVDGGGPTAAYKATSKTGFGGLIIAAAPTDEDNSAARTTPCGVAVKAADLGKQTFAKQRSSAANTDIPAGDPSGHVHNARRGNAYFTATDLPTKDSNGL